MNKKYFVSGLGLIISFFLIMSGCQKQTVQQSFESFFPKYLSALKSQDHEFLKKVYPKEYFQVHDSQSDYDFSLLDAEMVLKYFDNDKAEKKCDGNKCTVSADTGNGKVSVVYTLSGEQWLGYDADRIDKLLKKKSEAAAFKYDYSFSFAGFGPVKYEVSLNGKPVNEFLNYESGVSMNFVPGGLVAGENVMKITAAVDTASPDYSKDKGDTVDTSLSYTVYRIEKGNTDPMAIFDDNNILVQSSPDSIAHMEEITVGPDGYTQEVKFNIE